MYKLVGSAILLSLVAMLLPSFLGAPQIVSYPLLGIGAIGMLLANLGLVVCLDASLARLPMHMLNWIAGGVSSQPSSFPNPTDHRLQATLFNWQVPETVGLIEDFFLCYRLSHQMDSALSCMRLSETPKAQGREQSRRL